jgi:hypothetical protein
VGGLGHYLEEEGVPTAQISLIREHTEKIRPPRALWVPFELGRPLGIPNDAAWQRRVLHDVLKLFEIPSGPVLIDFPDEAPVDLYLESQNLVCPVNFTSPVRDLDDLDGLNKAFRQEILELRSSYDASVSKRGRTTVGVSGLTVEDAGVFVGAFLAGMPESPRQGVPALALLKLAVEDIKAYYLEAVAALPGPHAAGNALGNWFWRETAAARVLFTLQKQWRNSDDRSPQEFSRLLLIPRARQADSPYSARNREKG